MRISDWSSDVCSSDLFGRANIAGRPVVASADDFTVRGGAADAALHRKFVQCEAMAHEYRLPLIRMIDGTGGGGPVKSLEEIGREGGRERGWQYVWIAGGAASLKKRKD